MSKYLLCVAVAAFVFVRGADAAEIKLLSSNAVKEAFSQLIPQFEKATGHRVAVVWGGTPMRLSSVGADTRRSVLLVLHDTAQPWMTNTGNWKPKGLCPQ